MRDWKGRLLARAPGEGEGEGVVCCKGRDAAGDGVRDVDGRPDKPFEEFVERPLADWLDGRPMRAKAIGLDLVRGRFGVPSELLPESPSARVSWLSGLLRSSARTLDDPSGKPTALPWLSLPLRAEGTGMRDDVTGDAV